MRFKYLKIKILFLFFISLFSITRIETIYPKDNSFGPSIDYLYRDLENEYIIGPGDKLIIIVTRKINRLNGLYTIDNSGKINIPRLQRIYVEGLTISELSNLLTEEYKKIINKPKLEIDVVEYRPVSVYLDGEVTDPGLYSISTYKNDNSNQKASDSNLSLFTEQTEEIKKSEEDSLFERRLPFKRNFGSFKFPRLFDAIYLAGGITQYSDLSNVEVIRKESLSNGGGKKIAIVNFLDYINNQEGSQNIRIYDGDIIKIKKSKTKTLNQLSKAIKSNLNPKFINVFVRGRVETPGIIKVNKSSAVSDAIASAGGAKFIRGKVSLIRFNNDGTSYKKSIKLSPRHKRGTPYNPFLKNGDLIIVGKSSLNIANEIINDVTSPFLGIYSTYKIFD